MKDIVSPSPIDGDFANPCRTKHTRYPSIYFSRTLRAKKVCKRLPPVQTRKNVRLEGLLTPFKGCDSLGECVLLKGVYLENVCTFKGCTPSQCVLRKGVYFEGCVP